MNETRRKSPITEAISSLPSEILRNITLLSAPKRESGEYILEAPDIAGFSCDYIEPIDKFLRRKTAVSVRNKHEVLKMIREGLYNKYEFIIIRGIVDGKSKHNVYVIIDEIYRCVEQDNKFKIITKLKNLERFRIEAALHVSEIEVDSRFDDKMNKYRYDDRVQLLVLSLDRTFIECSSLQTRLRKYLDKYYNEVQLGLLGTEKDIIDYESEENDVRWHDAFNKGLQNDMSFKNPFSTKEMVRYFNIDEYASLLPQREFKSTDYYDEIREEQNRQFAREKDVSFCIFYLKRILLMDCVI